MEDNGKGSTQIVQQKENKSQVQKLTNIRKWEKSKAWNNRKRNEQPRNE